ncbi:ion transporter [Sulfurovum sp. bin170]|uniref:ion transporter n=1 Tax=Sulfurovum sp. bin170 TaxID=2695268 RepID=UPI0013DF2915|nr:ion transporter [Sulfurovum sp. bin170]NEW59714.1 ion transporter [Sulfurovum sp. bin170]
MEFKAKLINIREARWFSNLTTTIIIIYSSILGLKTMMEVDGNLIIIMHIMDYFVTIYFLIEIAIKMAAEEKTSDFFKSGWNIFDFVIVIITLIPLENTTMAAVARLLRIFRVLRLITARPGLKRIIDMLMGAIPSIVDIVILMFIIFYIYAILGNFLFAGVESGLWENFLIAMLTLFRILTFEDWTDVMYEGMEVHPWSWIYFVSFVIIAAFVFFNLFIAVIIGEMEKLRDEDDTEHEEEMEKLDTILAKMDELKEEIAELKSKS